MTPGIHNIPEDEYRADPAVANSDLKLIRRSPAHYYAARLDPNRPAKESTSSQIEGRALHCLMLEPDTFGDRFIYVPEDAPNRPSSRQINAKKPSPETIIAIDFWNDFNARTTGKDVIERAAAEDVRKCATALRAHPELCAYLREGVAEQSIFARDPETGMMCKIRPDWLTSLAGYTIMLDLKSTEDARPAAFARTAYNYDYFQGAAFYCDVHTWATRPQDAADDYRTVDTFILVAFEREAPYALKLYEVSPEAMARGRMRYREALNTYAECMRNYEWPLYDTTIESLDYPAWAKE